MAAEQQAGQRRIADREARRAAEREAERIEGERRQAVGEAEMRRRLETLREQMKAEEDAKAAAKAAEEQKYRDDLVAEGRGSGACRPRMTDVECLETAYVARLVSRACDAVDEIRGAQVEAQRELRNGRKYHVVDLEVLNDAKSHAGAMEDTLQELKDEIKERRGKAFSTRECKR
jgi:hypothetical protein